ncbi:MAG: ankyrin repeat domain-containing protein [Flavitalea sp.]
MNLTRKTIILLLLFINQLCYGQSGPWAKYDQKLKDDALYREASAGNLSEVKSIIEGGGNIHVTMEQTKSTILMGAAGSGKIEVVKFLLEKGADPMAKDWWNYTALDKAKFVGAKDIEELLLQYMKKVGDKKNSDTDKVPIIPRPAPVKIDNNFWPSFGFYKAGDSIIYWVPTGWRKGVIREVGVAKKSGKISVDYSEKKYLIDPDAYALSNDWYEWTVVVHPERQPFWTSWFVGIWKIGEVNAHSNEVKNGKETDRYYFLDATESLIVLANGTYTWKTPGKKTIKGKWIASKDYPGIILLKAYRNFNWELRNHTSVDDWFIRKLDIIELKPSANVGSIKGKRASSLR